MSQALEPLPGRILAYAVPVKGIAPSRELVSISRPDQDRRFVFYDSLVIGRLEPGAATTPGVLYISDPSVSERHCVITQDLDGLCFVRDMSLNGTRIDGRRLAPGPETEIRAGQILTIGQEHEFRLEGCVVKRQVSPRPNTLPLSTATEVTVLVGDIRRYTELVRDSPADLVQPCVNMLFQRLERLVEDHAGTVKEYPGDAILAYWESCLSENCAMRACRAALALDAEVHRLACDPAVWRLPSSPLRMDWALTTGKVMMERHGGPHAVGLSMVGTAVIKAFLLEKLADEITGSILVCGATRALAGEQFGFHDLGATQIRGFPSPERVFALVEAR